MIHTLLCVRCLITLCTLHPLITYDTYLIYLSTTLALLTYLLTYLLNFPTLLAYFTCSTYSYLLTTLITYLLALFPYVSYILDLLAQTTCVTYSNDSLTDVLTSSTHVTEVILIIYYLLLYLRAYLLY